MKKLMLVLIMLLTACSDDKEIIKEFENQLHYNYPLLNVSNAEVKKIASDIYQLKGQLILTEDTYRLVAKIDKSDIDENTDLVFIKRTENNKGDKISFVSEITRGTEKFHIKSLGEYNQTLDAYLPMYNHFGALLSSYSNESNQVYILDSKNTNDDCKNKINNIISYKNNLEDKVTETLNNLSELNFKEKELDLKENEKIKELNDALKTSLLENEKLMDNYRLCVSKTDKNNAVSGIKERFPYKGKVITNGADCSDIYLDIEDAKNKILDIYESKNKKIRNDIYEERQNLLYEKKSFKMKNEEYVYSLRQKIENLDRILLQLESHFNE